MIPEELDELVLDELELLEDELLDDELLEDELDDELEEFDELPPHPARPKTSTQTLVAVTKRDASFLSNIARPCGMWSGVAFLFDGKLGNPRGYLQ